MTKKNNSKNGWLYGWKAIAKYIGCSVRTAQRYHDLHAMPVRKGIGTTVFGLPEELDDWLENNSSTGRLFA